MLGLLLQYMRGALDLPDPAPVRIRCHASTSTRDTIRCPAVALLLIQPPCRATTLGAHSADESLLLFVRPVPSFFSFSLSPPSPPFPLGPHRKNPAAYPEADEQTKNSAGDVASGRSVVAVTPAIAPDARTVKRPR